MDKYIFYHNGEKINEEIILEYTSNDNISYKKIGNLYNLVDYINYSSFTNSYLEFINFKDSQMKFIISTIPKYKNIKVEKYNSFLISDKKRRIRGRNYDKMDRGTDRSNL